MTISIESRPLSNPAPFYDDRVIKFTGGRVLCRDTSLLSHTNGQPANGPEKGSPAPPGGVYIAPIGLHIDEAEISNIDWHLFELDQSDAEASAASNAPDPAVLPVSDYYSSPFYAFYPVVGISHEQARRFCAWRSKVVNKQLARSSQKNAADYVVEYRLPTETEWEEGTEVRSGQPYGIPCIELKVRVAPGAAAYLQKRANIPASVAKIKADIVAYNRQQPVRSWINYAQAEPYFLRLATPGYVYQGSPNYFGLYQMLGNAAEMVQEPGVTKGGSYRDELAACQIKARGHYTGPAPTVGFRAVCSVRRRPQP